tara:strand:- start:717 stop:1211 length:495 start_codon:yes stop_codon:yes gene_type:complete
MLPTCLLGLSLSLLLASLPALAAPVTLPHDEAMPADIYNQRQDKPEQVLFEVQEYRVVFASEQRPAAGSSSTQANSFLLLQGRTLLPGSPVQRAEVRFVASGAVLLPARLDARRQTLMLVYSESMLPVLLQQLNSPGAEYVQARFYGNGLIWGDIHSAPQTPQR